MIDAVSTPETLMYKVQQSRRQSFSKYVPLKNSNFVGGVENIAYS
jgi:hypothetical protein